MDTLAVLHDRLSITFLLFMLIASIWGFWLTLRGEGPSGSYWGTLAIGELLIVAEAILGVILFIAGRVPARTGVHILYGVVAVIALPAAFFFTRGRESRYETLIYAIVTLFLAGVTIRARLTGAG